MKSLRWTLVLAIVALAVTISLIPEPKIPESEKTEFLNTSLAKNFVTLSKIYLKKNNRVIDKFVQKHLDVAWGDYLPDAVMSELENSAQQLARNFQNYVTESDSLLAIIDSDKVWLKAKKIQSWILQIDKILLEKEIGKIIILQELIKQKYSTNKKSSLETRYIRRVFIIKILFALIKKIHYSMPI